MTRPLPRSTLFPYTTLFRSQREAALQPARCVGNPHLVVHVASLPCPVGGHATAARSEEHTSELQSQSNLVCRLLLEKKIHRLDGGVDGALRREQDHLDCVALVLQCLEQLDAVFFLNDEATTEIYTLSLHDALPISARGCSSASALRRKPSPCRSCRVPSLPSRWPRDGR